MATATLTSKGQITIPKAIRDKLRLNTGDRIKFKVQDDGQVTFTPETIDVGSLFGIIDPGNKHLTIDDINCIIRERDYEH